MTLLGKTFHLRRYALMAAIAALLSACGSTTMFSRDDKPAPPVRSSKAQADSQSALRLTERSGGGPSVVATVRTFPQSDFRAELAATRAENRFRFDPKTGVTQFAHKAFGIDINQSFTAAHCGHGGLGAHVVACRGGELDTVASELLADAVLSNPASSAYVTLVDYAEERRDAQGNYLIRSYMAAGDLSAADRMPQAGKRRYRGDMRGFGVFGGEFPSSLWGARRARDGAGVELTADFENRRIEGTMRIQYEDVESGEIWREAHYVISGVINGAEFTGYIEESDLTGAQGDVRGRIVGAFFGDDNHGADEIGATFELVQRSGPSGRMIGGFIGSRWETNEDSVVN